MTGQGEIWQWLCDQLRAYFSARGVAEASGGGDGVMFAENDGSPDIGVFFQNLDLLDLAAIAFARKLLVGLPDWTIEYVVFAERAPGQPLMGISIRQHEIIDRLDRAFLPERFRSFVIPDSRPGTTHAIMSDMGVYTPIESGAGNDGDVVTEQDEIWQWLHDQLRSYFRSRGVEGASDDCDFMIVEDNYSWPVHFVYILNLDLLDLASISYARGLLADLPGWTIAFVVDVVGKETEWPRMGVTIRQHEIIDSLQREFLPASFQAFVIPDSRREAGRD